MEGHVDIETTHLLEAVCLKLEKLLVLGDIDAKETENSKNMECSDLSPKQLYKFSSRTDKECEEEGVQSPSVQSMINLTSSSHDMSPGTIPISGKGINIGTQTSNKNKNKNKRSGKKSLPTATKSKYGKANDKPR
ncbi:uncharacterized protein LOC119683854 [Teleopsis dalmanni]|uniref:uncharacterized protein LOC119664601 n=1 Tax=Teleopsis dalmanni TaxID=139649 RepID=UPI0018CEF319|nr:uncharacterized protein LOC119664601 [Teleopsis dalmanni]XP_037953650.1 uncharacterized protein LOC119683854 [Teleopsis dalmanni]